jgi:catechol 2,3-dioxygenase-like lactoylglutathione lyase family enzyme
MAVSLSLASIVSDDIVGLSTFYAEVFDLAEVEELRSDIFRGLDLAGVTLGFSTPVVYELLKIEPWREAKGTKQYLTFEAEDDAGVDRLVARAVERGAQLLHEPYETYYGAWQAVLADPDGNVFRINRFR